MQTALHIRSLVIELRREILAGTIVSTEFYKKERAAFFFIETTNRRMALALLYHPTGSGCFLVPASKVRLETKEKPWPIFDLAGAEVVSIDQPTLDRIFYVTVKKNQTIHQLAFEATGPHGNIWLLDDKSGMQATLRHREYTGGERYEMSVRPDMLDPVSVSGASLATGFASANTGGKHISLPVFLEKRLVGFSRTLASEAIARAHLDLARPVAMGDSSWEAVASAVTDLASRFDDPSHGYLYTVAGASEAYPFKLSTASDMPEKFKTLSLAVKELTERRQQTKESAQEKRDALETLQRAAHKIERRIGKLEEDIRDAAAFEHFKKLGELLHANFHLLKRGLKIIKVADTYSDGHPLIEIPLDSALSPQANVESYFKRHRKGKEGLELLTRRLEVSRDELRSLQKMIAEFEQGYDSALQKYGNELTALVPRSAEQKSSEPRLPYRAYRLSTGLTILVGRDGSDNDRTTFEFAKPHDLWFHAQQCPGSHVVLKLPHKTFSPSRAEIEETASVAAYFSKARNDSLVPIAYTERRYVRKPRQAKPGLVVIEREKSVMVPPRKPD